MKAPKLATILLLTSGLSLTYTSLAFADQCAYTTKKQALAAVSRLEKGQTIYQFCEPCKDVSPRPVRVNSVSAGTVGYENFWGVSVNGQNIDLAYTYIDTAREHRKVNLAMLAQCPVQGVSRFIEDRW